MMKNTVFVVGVCLLIVGNPHFSYADDSERIRELEKKVEELTRLVNELMARQPAPPAPAVAEEPPLAAEIPEEEETVSPQLTLRGFGQIQYDYAQSDFSDDTAGNTNHFTTGELDLFITSRVNEKISFLNETLFEFEENGSHEIEVERLLLKYTANDKFNIAIGRGHTALGYWNQTFHHGTWLQTTADRPVIYRWEHDGGILPSHYTGLEFSGAFVDMPGGTLSYVANLANGRGDIASRVQMTNDDNDSKLAGIMLTYKPAAMEGLGFGANYIRDIIPPRPGTANRGDEIDENLSGAHLFYLKDSLEVIAEGQFINHFNHATGLRDWTLGGYGQLAYKTGKYKPYVRFDWLNIADRDPFYGGSIEDETSQTLGLRYDLTTFNALKLEYRYIDKDNSRSNEATLQSAFAF